MHQISFAAGEEVGIKEEERGEGEKGGEEGNGQKGRRSYAPTKILRSRLWQKYTCSAL